MLKHEPSRVWKNGAELHEEHHYAKDSSEIESPEWKIHQAVAENVMDEVLFGQSRVDPTKFF